MLNTIELRMEKEAVEEAAQQAPHLFRCLKAIKMQPQSSIIDGI